MDHLTVTVYDTAISATYHPSLLPVPTAPLVVAVHGGTYTSEYYRVAGSPWGSFVDVATRNGCPVLTLDRPCYGASAAVPDQENTFAGQALILAAAVTELLPRVGHSAAALVGHSIGGMVCLEMAALSPEWPLCAVAVSGMGARLRSDGMAPRLAAVSGTGLVDMPVPARELAMFGTPDTYTAQARRAAAASYAPAPAVELQQAPRWAADRLTEVAAAVSVPVYDAIADADALWDSSDEALAAFVGLFPPGGAVRAERVRHSGHSIDHHLAAGWLQLRQIAFILEAAAA